MANATSGHRLVTEIKCKCRLKHVYVAFSLAKSHPLLYTLLAKSEGPVLPSIARCTDNFFVYADVYVSHILLGTLSCFLGWICGPVNNFDPLDIDPVICRSAHAADHSLDLLPESLIHQSVHNWVDSGIEHEHCVSNSLCYTMNAVTGNMSGEDVANRVR